MSAARARWSAVRSGRSLIALLVVGASLLWGALACSRTLPLERIELPEGFRIGLFSDAVPGARSLAFGPKGTLFVGTREEGKVYALRDEDGNGRAETVRTLLSGLDRPNGVAVNGGDLYVAERRRVLRLRNVERQVEDPSAPQVVITDLPADPVHGWRYIGFAPDGALYVAVGAPCNVCKRYGEIRRYDLERGRMMIFARGVRNSVGFDWHPQTGVLWFTDNGRDGMGDDRPPDELNRAPRAALHFGFPFCHGERIADPRFGEERPCNAFTPPARSLGPHVAALGMRFYTGHQFPPAYRGHIFIAEHGSWDRSEKIGYRVTWVRVRDSRAVSYEVFAQGWLQGGREWGRPVDVAVAPDGALVVSDDKAGAIYRITYTAAGPS